MLNGGTGNDEDVYVDGDKRIEFKKGKNAIELPSKAELEPTLRNIKKAVEYGEFDRLLEEQLAYGSRLT